jgi:hypothetical protein
MGRPGSAHGTARSDDTRVHGPAPRRPEGHEDRASAPAVRRTHEGRASWEWRHRPGVSGPPGAASRRRGRAERQRRQGRGARRAILLGYPLMRAGIVAQGKPRSCPCRRGRCHPAPALLDAGRGGAGFARYGGRAMDRAWDRTGDGGATSLVNGGLAPAYPDGRHLSGRGWCVRTRLHPAVEVSSGRLRAGPLHVQPALAGGRHGAARGVRRRGRHLGVRPPARRGGDTGPRLAPHLAARPAARRVRPRAGVPAAAGPHRAGGGTAAQRPGDPRGRLAQHGDCRRRRAARRVRRRRAGSGRRAAPRAGGPLLAPLLPLLERRGARGRPARARLRGQPLERRAGGRPGDARARRPPGLGHRARVRRRGHLAGPDRGGARADQGQPHPGLRRRRRAAGVRPRRPGGARGAAGDGPEGLDARRRRARAANGLRRPHGAVRRGGRGPHRGLRGRDAAARRRAGRRQRAVHAGRARPAAAALPHRPARRGTGRGEQRPRGARDRRRSARETAVHRGRAALRDEVPAARRRRRQEPAGRHAAADGGGEVPPPRRRRPRGSARRVPEGARRAVRVPGPHPRQPRGERVHAGSAADDQRLRQPPRRRPARARRPARVRRGRVRRHADRRRAPRAARREGARDLRRAGEGPPDPRWRHERGDPDRGRR